MIFPSLLLVYHSDLVLTFLNISEHCIDSIRQLVTCHSDISTHYWRWEDWHKKPGARVYSQTTHTCRNFEKIQQWAVEHRLRDFDFFTHVDDPLHPGNGERVDGVGVV
jgi:hypothetical protein